MDGGRLLLRVLVTTTMVVADARPVTAAGGEALAVIVNRHNPTASLSLAELRHLFLKVRRRWDDGRPVLVINHKAGMRVRVAFDRAVLGMSRDAVATYWIKQRVRGLGHPPRSFRSSAIIVRLVAKQREAVAYVPISALSRAGWPAEVKVLRIDGRMPGDRRYRLSAGIQE